METNLGIYGMGRKESLAIRLLLKFESKRPYKWSLTLNWEGVKQDLHLGNQRNEDRN
jgi:hypothetical protein